MIDTGIHPGGSMPVFHWDDSYSVGIADVDRQHRVLVEMINALDDALATGSGDAQTGEILSDLYAYAQYHFSAEEALMQRAGAPLAEHCRTHREQHRRFTETIQRLEREKVGSELFRALLEYLVRWLSFHILGSDKEMARLLSASPAEPAGEAPNLERMVAEHHLLGALHESELRFRNLADTLPVLIWLADESLKRNFFNHPWSELTGLSVDELRSGNWQACIHPDDRKAYLKRCRTSAKKREAYHAEFRIRDRAGRYGWWLETAIPRFHDERFAGYIGSLVDITERKQAEEILERQVAQRTQDLVAANENLRQEKEEQRRLIEKLEEAHTKLLQSEKMASIGQLAAGVAHEINNPVGYVMSNLGTLEHYVTVLLKLVDDIYAITSRRDSDLAGELEKLREGTDYDYLHEDILALVHESREGMERVKQIVLDLKEFSHVDQEEWQSADLNRGLQSTLNVVWNELKYKAEVVRDFGELPRLECLPGQLNQVFMNLLINAAQAIENRGTITIRTRFDGTHITISISDTGSGIPPEHLTRIFDPFFTTKAVGRGTGLGLSIAYGIVEKHGGRIEVESEPGSGTTFHILLPVDPSPNVGAPSSKREPPHN